MAAVRVIMALMVGILMAFSTETGLAQAGDAGAPAIEKAKKKNKANKGKSKAAARAKAKKARVEQPKKEQAPVQKDPEPAPAASAPEALPSDLDESGDVMETGDM